MLRPRRIAAVAALVMCLVGVAAAPAFAGDPYGSTTCSQNPHPGCELAAGQDGTTAGPDQGVSPPRSAPDDGSTGDRATPPPGDVALGPSDSAHCAYVRSDFQPPAAPIQPVGLRSTPRGSGPRVVAAADWSGTLVVRPAATGPDGRPGSWYVYQCQTPGLRDALYRPPVWIADAPAGPAPAPAALAEQARNQLRLAGPAISMSPVRDQLVQLPTWLWLDAAGWNQVAATAAAGGVAVTAVAKPVSVVWSLGDGGTVTCTGPGTPFPAGADPKSASPDCGYTYRHRSLDEPGGTFTVTATVRWDVTWAGAGQAGAFPGLTTTSTVPVRVIDIPSLTTGGG
ncbi:ATP/GTP-binding protein [Frankia sp. B2]|uniref:ATP/GTP-binding protein n=1 Tax=Frankia sp. B2 TaxID=2541730 RepID=UPI00141AFC0F|nr:ATP/GTP-binding protein [Frankia sp. B2]